MSPAYTTEPDLVRMDAAELTASIFPMFFDGVLCTTVHAQIMNIMIADRESEQSIILLGLKHGNLAIAQSFTAEQARVLAAALERAADKIGLAG